MQNVVRKWLPLTLIALAIGASVAAFPNLPSSVRLDMSAMFPVATPPSEPGSRWLVTTLVPALALVMWGLFRLGPTERGQRFARRFFFKGMPDEITAPAEFERFAPTYDQIVLGVVLLIVGMHGMMLSAALGHPIAAARMVALATGLFLIVAGNVMPRLRPNWVAGLRSKRLLLDRQLWRNAHRAFGAAFVISGIVTIAVSLAAPRYGVLTALVLLGLSCVAGYMASGRGSGRVVHALVVAFALLRATGERR